MKLVKTTLFFGILVAMAMSVSAESLLVNVNVPFSFVAGGKTLPAGTYSIEEPSNQGVLIIRGNAPGATVVALAVNNGSSTTNQAGVSFSRIGKEVMLSGVQVPGGSSYALVAPEHKALAAVNVALPRK